MALMQIQSRGLGCLHLPFQIAQKAVSKLPLSSKIYVTFSNNYLVSLVRANICNYWQRFSEDGRHGQSRTADLTIISRAL